MTVFFMLIMMMCMALTACGESSSQSAVSESGPAQDTSQTFEAATTSQQAQSAAPSESSLASEQDEPSAQEKILISVGGKDFTAELYDTEAAKEFKQMLPLTVKMSELNGNEKYIYLDTSFTARSQQVGKITKGQLMLYGDNCLVLFYDSFSTSYSYTPIGCIDDPDGLEQALGKKSASVSFSLAK